MLEHIAQLGKGGFQLLIGRRRNLPRKLLDEILPILVRKDRVIGRQRGEGGPDHLENVGLGVEARLSHALHEARIELTGAAFHLIEIGDMDLVSLVRL